MLTFEKRSRISGARTAIAKAVSTLLFKKFLVEVFR